jgi:hypothetical protein
MNQKIPELWNIHLASKFPRGYGGETIEGIDLVLLDSDIAGCVSTFITNNGQLDLFRTAILGRCYRDSTIVTSHLAGEAKERFSRLETLSNLVLKDIITVENNKRKSKKIDLQEFSDLDRGKES